MTALLTPTASLAATLERELASVAARFDRELQSDVPAVRQLVRHVSRFRGKMLRPMLVLLAGKACVTDGLTGEHHEIAAAVVELAHMATLVHDDVLDEAELRRRGATINHLRGNEAAVLLGDYLISHAYHLCSSLTDARPARLVAAATNKLCEGELIQNVHRGDLDLDEATYFDALAGKTGALTAVSCRLGALLSGASEDVCARLEKFGLLLGVAFQVQDDVLDLVGDAERVGKTLGGDLDKGKLTLPLIRFLATAPAEHRALLRGLLKGRAEPDRAERVRQLIAPSDALAYARAKAAELARQAIEQLAALPASAAKDALAHAARLAVTRDH